MEDYTFLEMLGQKVAEYVQLWQWFAHIAGPVSCGFGTSFG